jgi:hypothetical protein
MRADPDGPGYLLRETTIQIVLDRLVTVEFFELDTEPQIARRRDPEPRGAGQVTTRA